MAYFNHAYQKAFFGGGSVGYINAAGQISSSLLGTHGVGAFSMVDQDAANWPTVATAPSNGKPLTLVATSLYQSDKIGPFHGGYQETSKSKMINPKYVNKFYVVEPKPAQTHVIGVGLTPNLGDTGCCPQFYCNENYYLRLDLKGSPALRSFSRNLYPVTSAYTGCCDGPTPELVDPALVMQSWMEDLTNDPTVFGIYNQDQQRLINVGVTVTCDDGVTWDLYLPANETSGIAGLYFQANGTTLTSEGQAFVDSVEDATGGLITGTTAIVAGTNYANATNVPVTGGSGSGATVDITTSGGGVTVVAINNPGAGYTAGDTLTITGGDENATFDVDTVGTLSFNSVLPMTSYSSTFDPSDPNCCAGLVIESAFVETKFNDCTFQPTDNYEIEPLLIQASVVDETGDPCVFEQMCISDGITPSTPGSNTVLPAIQFGTQVMGTGESVVRDIILSESYDQNHFHNDLRIREITQGNDVLSAIDRNVLYYNYYILHSVPRFNNPTGVFDNDQYLLKITTTGREADFETFMAAWLTGANNPTTLEVL